MIFKEGWRSIALYWRWVMEALWEAGAPIWSEIGETDSEAMAKAHEWFQPIKQEILNELEHLKILLPGGELVDADTVLIRGLEGDMTHDVDLTVGTIGSGYFRISFEDEYGSLDRLVLERQYGYLLGCPLLVKEDEAERAFRKHIPWVEGGLKWASTKPPRMLLGVGEGRTAPGPGRPALEGGLIKRMVQKQFGPRLAPGGDLADEPKKMVHNALARAWIEGLTDIPVKESTMRDYLAPLYAARPSDDGK